MPLVTLNVGGTEYTTALSTLCRCPDSMLARMFEGDFPPTEKDGKDRYFIDRDGDTFKWILRYLRNEKTCLPTCCEQRSILRQEAEYYQLEDLVARLGEYSSTSRYPGSLTPVSVTSHFQGHIAGCGAIPMEAATHGAASRHKINWIQQAAPMPALRRSIEVLLTSFWGSPCDVSALDLRPRMEYFYFSARDRARNMCLSPQEFKDPPDYLFLTTKDEQNDPSVTYEWMSMPDDLQEIVRQWFHLFCMELTILGYCVSVTRTNGLRFQGQNNYHVSIADKDTRFAED